MEILKPIEEYDRMIWSCAHRFKSTRHTVDARYGVAAVGFIKAYKAFDPTKGIKFTTFAHRCMNNELLMMCRVTKKHENVVSLDSPYPTDNDGNDITQQDIISYPDQKSPEEQQQQTELTIQVKKRLDAKLKGREADVIYYRYYKGLPQNKVSTIIGISRSYISRIEQAALKRLAEDPELQELYQTSRSEL